MDSDWDLDRDMALSPNKRYCLGAAQAKARMESRLESQPEPAPATRRMPAQPSLLNQSPGAPTELAQWQPAPPQGSINGSLDSAQALSTFPSYPPAFQPSQRQSAAALMSANPGPNLQLWLDQAQRHAESESESEAETFLSQSSHLFLDSPASHANGSWGTPSSEQRALWNAPPTPPPVPPTIASPNLARADVRQSQQRFGTPNVGSGRYGPGQQTDDRTWQHPTNPVSSASLPGQYVPGLYSAMLSPYLHFYAEPAAGMNGMFSEASLVEPFQNGIDSMISASSASGFMTQLGPQSAVLGQRLLPHAVHNLPGNQSPIGPGFSGAAPDGSALPGPRSAPVKMSHHPQSPETPQGSKRRYAEMDQMVGSVGNVERPNLLVQKPRRFPTRKEKEEANEVRALDGGACVRCRSQKNKCKVDPRNPQGPCDTCLELSNTMDNLPCFRYKLMDAIFFRTDVDSDTGRPSFDINFAILKPVAEWDAGGAKFIELTAGYGSVIRFRVQMASALHRADITDPERFIYDRPWALADYDEAVKEVGNFLRSSIPRTIEKELDKRDVLARQIFREACLMALNSTLLDDVLMIWNASRHIEGGWLFHGSETLGQQTNDGRAIPLTDTPMLDSQISSIIVLHHLQDAQKSALKTIEKWTNERKDFRIRHWFELFLAQFILLHNCECIMRHQRKWATQTNPQFRYAPKMLKLVKGILSTVEAFLYHWRYSLKGQFPFDQNWESDRTPKIAELCPAQRNFVKWIAGRVEGKADYFNDLFQHREWERHYSFTGQLFVRNWLPMPVMEELPLAPAMGPRRPST